VQTLSSHVQDPGHFALIPAFENLRRRNLGFNHSSPYSRAQILELADSQFRNLEAD